MVRAMVAGSLQAVISQVMLKRKGGRINGSLDAIGVIETTTVASSILSADAALKTATVDLIDIRIANGLGGKSFFTVTGEVSDVRSAVMAGAAFSNASPTVWTKPTRNG